MSPSARFQPPDPCAKAYQAALSRSGFVKERLYVGEAIIATLFGIAFSYGFLLWADRSREADCECWRAQRLRRRHLCAEDLERGCVMFPARGALGADGRGAGTGHHFDEITLELTRIVIALSVFAVGVELPKCVAEPHLTRVPYS